MLIFPSTYPVALNYMMINKTWVSWTKNKFANTQFQSYNRSTKQNLGMVCPTCVLPMPEGPTNSVSKPGGIPPPRASSRPFNSVRRRPPWHPLLRRPSMSESTWKRIQISSISVKNKTIIEIRVQEQAGISQFDTADMWSHWSLRWRSQPGHGPSRAKPSDQTLEGREHP